MLRIIIWARPSARYLFAAWLIVILVLSSIPNVPTLKIHTAGKEFRLDYLMHFGEYGILAFLSILASAGQEFIMTGRRWLIVVTGLIVFAYLDEFHQKIIPGRTYNIHDFLSNAAGILCAAVIALIMFRIIRNKELVKGKPD